MNLATEQPSRDVSAQDEEALQTEPVVEEELSKEELLARGWAALPEGYRISDAAPTLEEARAYCQRLAETHYENFHVATWFLPKALRPHFTRFTPTAESLMILATRWARRRKRWRCSIYGAKNLMLAMRDRRGIRYSWRWRKPFASARSRKNRLRIC